MEEVYGERGKRGKKVRRKGGKSAQRETNRKRMTSAVSPGKVRSQKAASHVI